MNALYTVALGKPISDYPKYDLIQLLLDKRHLFTHRGGRIDTKFLRAYNAYHAGGAERLLDDSMLGRQAFVEPEWLRDSVREARAFVSWVAAPLPNE